MSKEIYKDYLGREFRFNDPIECTASLLPIEERIGRLVQVRKEQGICGTDIYIVRKPDDSLATFENVGLKHHEGTLPENKSDSGSDEYTIMGKFPEKGFIVEYQNILEFP